MTAERLVDAVIYVFAVIGLVVVMQWMDKNGPWWWGFAFSGAPLAVALACLAWSARSRVIRRLANARDRRDASTSR